jgi:hypothetical protein
MPRIRVEKLWDGRYQIAVLGNNRDELPHRMAVAGDPAAAKKSLEALIAETYTARDNIRAARRQLTLD